jgi:hypothetical protein
VFSAEENMRVNRPKYTDRGNYIMRNFKGEVFTKYYQDNPSNTMIQVGHTSHTKRRFWFENLNRS